MLRTYLKVSRLSVEFLGLVFTFNKREYELWKLPLNSSCCAITADSKSRWPRGKNAYSISAVSPVTNCLVINMLLNVIKSRCIQPSPGADATMYVHCRYTYGKGVKGLANIACFFLDKSPPVFAKDIIVSQGPLAGGMMACWRPWKKSILSALRFVPWVPEVSRSPRAGAKITGGGGLGARRSLQSPAAREFGPSSPRARNLWNPGYAFWGWSSNFSFFIILRLSSIRSTQASTHPSIHPPTDRPTRTPSHHIHSLVLPLTSR